MPACKDLLCDSIACLSTMGHGSIIIGLPVITVIFMGNDNKKITQPLTWQVWGKQLTVLMQTFSTTLWVAVFPH